MVRLKNLETTRCSACGITQSKFFGKTMAISTSLQAAPAKQSRSNWQQLSRQITLQVMAIVLPVTLLASAANAASLSVARSKTE